MRKIFAAFIILVISQAAFADDTEDLGRIVVTPSRLAGYMRQALRSVTTLDEGTLEVSGWDNVVDRIGDLGGIDMRRRGTDGVQADVNIRGATFDQNTVLIDGIVVNDPQTGHYNMDLPLTSSDIDRVEIVKGPVSSLYGPNSFGGAINIITKKAGEKKVEAYAEGGSFDYVRGGLSISYPAGPIKNKFSYEQYHSSGYRPQTWFDVISLSDSASVDTFLGVYNFLFGYSVKDFGANQFYSNMFPNEAENTDTRFFKIDGTADAGNLKVAPKLYLRRHRDKFRLDTNRPGWQTNYSTTYVYGGGVDLTLENPILDTAYGFNISRDTMDSTSMQTHSRTGTGVYMEVSPKLADDLDINAGIRQDYYSDFGLEYSPSISAAYMIFKGFAARAAIGRSYRIPTFTDLYYSDAANAGNSALKPESSWTYEAGAEYKLSLFDCSAIYFYRQSYDTIDWTRATALGIWRATNIGSTSTNGLELNLNITPRRINKSIPLDRVFFGYTVLDIYAKHDYLSKYALDYLKQHITAGAEWSAGPLKNYWVLNYKKRIGDSGFIVVDTKITMDLIKASRMSCEAFFEITNLFNIDYSEQSDIPMPGRWIRSGASMRF